MRKASGNCRSRFRPVLHRSVPLHLLLGSKGAGGGKRTRYPVQGHPHHGQRIRAELPAPVTTYALFRDGKFLTQSIQSDKKFLALAGIRD